MSAGRVAPDAAVEYLDTSAAVKLLNAEEESGGLRSYLARDPIVVSSDLLETELRRIGVRLGIERDLVTAILDRVTLVPLRRDHFRTAGSFPDRGLRSLDALHLAAALAIDAAAILTYDVRLADASRAHGLTVVAPG